MKTKELAALDRKLDFWTATKDQHDIDKHNAALVPDLLAALEFCMDAGNIKYEGRDWRREASAAISKARGDA